MIPKQLQKEEFRFCLLKAKDKIPFEKDWTNKGYKFNDPKLLEHIKKGGNYGVIGGYGNLIILDKDDDKLNIDFSTFTIKTGSGGKHYYLISDYKTNHVFVDELGELRANNYQVVGAGCTHPNGNKYTIEKDFDIKEISGEELQGWIKPYLRDETSTTESKKGGKDTSKSGEEMRRIIKLIREGKTEEEVFEEMKIYAKWCSSPDGYKEMTYNKALTWCMNHPTKKESNAIKETERKKEEELKQKLLEEYKERISKDENVTELLKDKNLFNILIKELNKKIEGEEKSKRAILLSLCSIWNKDSEVPLNTLVSSESSAGKSFICKNIIKLFPKELVEYRTKITPEAFTYWKQEEDWSWDGKICYLEDISQSILDAPTFKVMCSEGSVATIVVKQKAVDIEIKGKPVMLVTTARTNPNTEILNRFQIISLDESEEQTKAIVFRQALQKNGVVYDKKITDSFKILKRKNVYVPYAENIANFLENNYNFSALRLRRDFSRLMDLIKCSAVLHQYQRKEGDSGIIEATEQDYLIASEVINYIQTTTFKGLTHKLKKAFDCCKELYEFTAKEIHASFPFVNQKMWYNYLDDLGERGMLTAELKKTEDSKKQVTYYKINDEVSFTLPNYKDLLQNITINTLVTNDTNVTNVTNVNRTNVRNVRNVVDKNKEWSEEDKKRLEFASKNEKENIH